MQPHNNQILFKPFAHKEISENGLFIPETCRKASNKGTIIKVGKGAEKKPMRLIAGMVGHRVKDWGTEVIIDGEQYFLMEQDAILAIE